MKILSIMTLILSTNVFAADYIVGFDKEVTAVKMKELQKIENTQWESFSGKSEYFKKTLKVSLKKNMDQAALLKISGVTRVEDIIEVSSKSVISAQTNSDLATDPLVPYLWGLDYLGQVVINELNDLENIRIVGDETSDIELSDIEKLEKAMQKDPVVAIIDTGIDLSHPDLKDNIYRNMVECDANGEIRFDAEDTLDDNKYPGDCMGWDFTGKKELGTNRPEDFVGHGTHLAGIISAVRNNGIGVAGISNKIKILPIRVLSNKAEDSHAIGTSDRLADAILYAADMKADVINLSLGWPIAYDKQHLRAAVNEALERGVTIVAAAGNNDHSEPIFPCAYKGVICVGSIDPNKNFSDFSNFGGYVDVLAPGNNILSTYTRAKTPLIFDFEGYEIKSGTSQAAPYVSALAALIKAVHPEINEKELKAKVYASTYGPYSMGKKYASGGKVNFDKALWDETKVYIQPDFKTLKRVKVNAKTGQFNFELNLDNLSPVISQLTVEVKDNATLNFNKNSFNVGEMAGNQSKTLQMSGIVKNLNDHLFQTVTFVLKYAGKTLTYSNEIRMYVDFDENENILRLPINNAIPDEVLSLSTINHNHGEYDKPAYYSTKELKDTGIVFSLYEVAGQGINKIGATMIDNVKQILSVHRLDMNFDGTTDYMVRALIKVEVEGEDPTEHIEYLIFDNKLKPLFFKEVEIDGKKKRVSLSQWKLKFEGVILSELDNFSLVPFESADFGKILIPVFLGYAKQPEVNENPNPFTRLRKRIFSAKVFYLTPEIGEEDKVELITNTFNTYSFVDAFKKAIGFKPFEQIYMLKVYKQSLSDIAEGRVRILVTHEKKNTIAANYMFEISNIAGGEWNLTKLSAGDVNLSNYALDRAIDLSAEKQSDHFNNLMIVTNEQSSPLMWDQVVINAQNLSAQTVRQSNPIDPIQFPIKTYLNGDKVYRFFQTPSRIFMQFDEAGMTKTTTLPVHVSTFLPGLLFKEQHYPIVVKSHGENYPAFYVDSTQIVSRNVYTIVAKEDKMVAPIALNVNVPEKCVTKNPLEINGEFHYAMLCLKDNGGGEMIYYPVVEN